MQPEASPEATVVDHPLVQHKLTIMREKDTALPEFEKTLIRIAMAKTKGHRQAAAKLLGWGRNTLARKMKSLQMD